MPDTRSHRGPHPNDHLLFAHDQLPRLRRAVADYSWLLSHGYPPHASLKLVGDHLALPQRQRLAVMRSACSQASLTRRRSTRIRPSSLAGQHLRLDGYNVLTTVEAALAHAVLLLGRDGCLRDLASVHGTWRKVEETCPAAVAIGRFLHHHLKRPPAACTWLLDKPVSNSGRLRALLLDRAAQNAWPWSVELVFNPDALLADTPDPVATSDSVILDRAAQWTNLARAVIETILPTATLRPHILNLAAPVA